MYYWLYSHTYMAIQLMTIQPYISGYIANSHKAPKQLIDSICRKEHQKCSSGMFISGPQDPPFKSYGQQLFSQGKCLVFYIVTLKKIRNTFSRPDRDLAQKAKCSEILCRSIIQAIPTISINLCKSVSVYFSAHMWQKMTKCVFCSGNVMS